MINQDQHKIPTGTDPHTPAADLLKDIDLSGKTAIVTGGYSGIGLETTRALAGAGARVIIPARDLGKAKSALSSIQGQIEIAPMDLADLSSVRKFASDVTEGAAPVDILINNAGIMACPLSRTATGWETQFGVNHLGHMVMTLGLLPALRRASSGARLVCLSSTGHGITDIHWDDPNFNSHDYDKWQAYGQSKTANALFAAGLDQREKDNGIRAFAVHPGGIMTDLQRHLGNEEMVQLGWTDESGNLSERAKGMFKTPAAGASTSIFAATSPLLNGKGGVYCEDCDIADLADADTARYHKVRGYAVDTEAADRLWTLSEKLIGDA
ncbi:oxidoreductase [Ponticaulis sp.]|uniref:oxidoreductase n=1 Tax=Ponticaulis sp. TaxID=2020902 RepID=UPI000B657968|nr:oxidoreductase [Ponticaulis sp.]MAI91396.1 oxidoreductase [Ponticaulis sp.]OUX97758.1 MAG: oxidoreductase [Hyphomonadaceae bacterium TMED5]|tara:strand:+ start:3166 stop:4140 length:975 start_codon:yes stop_codon:yes gene_type:complete